jgi:retinol dehydrogenase-12
VMGGRPSTYFHPVHALSPKVSLSYNSLQVNFLSTYLLAALLAPLLKRTARLPNPNPPVSLKPHLVFATTDCRYLSYRIFIYMTSFLVHPYAKFPQRDASTILAALNDKDNYDVADQYTISKLLVLILAHQLASSSFWSSDDHSKDDVVICSVNPGFCRSNLQKNMPAVARWYVSSIYIFQIMTCLTHMY